MNKKVSEMKKNYYNIGRIFIDFRTFYSIWEDDKWSDALFFKGEIEEFEKREGRKYKIKKISWFKQNYNSNKWFVKKVIAYIISFTLGFIIGKFLLNKII